jgi:hypothetical protein
MHMLGKTNWRIPAALDRILPRLALESGPDANETGEQATTTETEFREFSGTESREI